VSVGDRDFPPITFRSGTQRARYCHWHTVQIMGRQVCAFPVQMDPRAGTRPPPPHVPHRSLLFMIAPCRRGLPPGGLHPIGADHCPEREPSRAWSEVLTVPVEG
jgi:hypothetical protein